MYRQKVKCSIDEMIEMLWEMPVDIVESCLFTMDRLGMEGCPKEDPLYSEKEYLCICSYLRMRNLVTCFDNRWIKILYSIGTADR